MKNFISKLFVITNTLLITFLFGQVDSTYYPLKVGNYWEYSTRRPAYGLYSLFRQGIIDTIRIDNQLWYQQYSFWGVNDFIDLLRIDESGNVLTHNYSGVPDTLIILSQNYMVGEGRQWLVSSFGGDHVYGYLRPSFEDVLILPLDIVESQCIQANYNYSNVLYWSAQYAPNIGKVRIMAEGAESFLHSMKLGESINTIASGLGSNQLDTIQFDVNSYELSCINNSNLEFDLSFDPSALEWNNYSLYSIEYFVNPELSTYEIDFDATVGDQNFQFSFDSYTLSETGYWDVISMNSLPPLQSKSGLITIAGELSEAHHDSLPRLSEFSTDRYITSLSTARECMMEPDSFKIRLVFYGVTVGIDPMKVIPTEFNVEPAYPNPFNSSTTIEYELPKTTNLTIVVYDLLGQNVWTYEESGQAAGSYSLQWNGENGSGKQVDSGVYLISLSTPEFRTVQKAVLIR